MATEDNDLGVVLGQVKGNVVKLVVSLDATGLTTGEISAHFQEIYGASGSKNTVSRITDRVPEELYSWQSRPLERVYAVIFIAPRTREIPPAIVVKVRDGQVANWPFYAAVSVALAGKKGHPWALGWDRW